MMSELNKTNQKSDLPSGWRVVELGNVTKLTNVKFDLKDLVLNKYISTDNMLKNLGGIERAKKIPLIGKVKKFQEGDVLFSNIRTYFRKVWYASLDGGCSNDVLVFRSTKGIYSRYMYYLLADNTFIDYTDKTSKGTKMPRGDKNAILKYSAYIPPLSEQKAIAHILGKLDDKIALNRQINQTLETMAQTLFKSWFVNFDPVIDNALKAGNPIPDSLKTQATKRKTTKSTLPKTTQNLFPNRFVFNNKLKKWIPEGWEVSTIGKEFDVVMGQSPPGSTYNSDYIGTPFFQGKTDFGFRFPKKRIYCTKSKREANKNDVLISVRAPVGNANIALFGCAIGRGLCAVKHKSNSVSYSYYSIKNLKKVFDSFEGEGTIFGSINQNDLKNISVIKPSLALIKEFDKKIGKNDKQIETLHNKAQTLTKLRDTLLPKLISGKIRIFAKD